MLLYLYLYKTLIFWQSHWREQIVVNCEKRFPKHKYFKVFKVLRVYERVTQNIICLKIFKSKIMIPWNSAVFPKVNWSWMDIWSSKGVWITGPSIKFKGHAHTPQRRCLDSYWSFDSVMNKFLLDQTSFDWTFDSVMNKLLLEQTSFDLTLSDGPGEWLGHTLVCTQI